MVDRAQLKRLCGKNSISHVQQLGGSDGLAWTYRRDLDGGYSMNLAIHLGIWTLNQTDWVPIPGTPAYSDIALSA